MALTLDVSESPTTFMTMAGLGDNGSRYAPGRNQPGKCTRWNWLAAGGGVGFQNTTSLYSAVDGWNTTPNQYRHPMTVKPSRGMVICFGATPGPRWAGDVNWPYGDYATFTGANIGDDPMDWQLVATDAAGSGVISTVTVRDRIRQTGGRSVLGWSDYLGGAVLTHGDASPTPADSTQTIPQEDDPMLKSFIAQTLIGKGPGTDTWLFHPDPVTPTYEHMRSATEIGLATAAGAVVISGPQPKDAFRRYKYVDIDGKGIR